MILDCTGLQQNVCRFPIKRKLISFMRNGFSTQKFLKKIDQVGRASSARRAAPAAGGVVQLSTGHCKRRSLKRRHCDFRATPRVITRCGGGLPTRWCSSLTSISASPSNKPCRYRASLMGRFQHRLKGRIIHRETFSRQASGEASDHCLFLV